MPSALINVPPKAKRGDIIEIKALMSHIMETGYRPHRGRGHRAHATSSPASPAATTALKSSAPDFFPGDRRQPVHLVLHSRQGERQISTSNGSATRVFFRNPPRPPSRSNDPRARYRCSLVCLDRPLGGISRSPPFPPPAPAIFSRMNVVSGYSFMAPDTKAIQDDDTANPGMLWVLDGEALWKKETGFGGQGPARTCHDGRTRQHERRRGTLIQRSTRSWNSRSISKARINLERVRHQGAEPLAFESRDLLALTAFIAKQSRGVCDFRLAMIRRFAPLCRQRP